MRRSIHAQSSRTRKNSFRVTEENVDALAEYLFEHDNEFLFRIEVNAKSYWLVQVISEQTRLRRYNDRLRRMVACGDDISSVPPYRKNNELIIMKLLFGSNE